MKKMIVLLVLVFVTKFYGQNEIKNMENVKRNYESGMNFLRYDSKGFRLSKTF